MVTDHNNSFGKMKTSKIYNGSWLSNVYVWISLELTLIHFNSALINNSNLSPVLVNFTTKNSQVHHHNTSHNTTTANPSSELRFENSSFSTDSSEYGEILGTAAAYKQDIRQPLIGCSLSEFTCLNGKCIPISKFCDRNNDCDDNSDEPRFCTRCNRTYYGDLGSTYFLDLPRPREERLPFVCHLNFTAAGGIHGDIVQITIDGFNVGKFCSYINDGCPDGYMQISEANRELVSGMWCGSMDDGPVVLYSETRTLVLTLKLIRNTKNISGQNFEFRMSYKVLPRETAVVRFGGVPKKVSNTSRSSTSYHHKNIFKDSEPHEDDNWLMTTRTVDESEHNIRNINTTVSSRRNKDRKKEKDRERDRDKYRDQDQDLEFTKNRNIDRDIANQDRKNLNSNSQYEDFISSNVKKPNKDQNFGHVDKKIERISEKSSLKSFKEFIPNKPYGIWPTHSKMEMNSYSGNKTESKYYLGTLISGTHCSRIFSDCDKKTCRLLSPNYPGIYHRNLTCYYAIRQHDVPPGKHALITVRQPEGDLIWIQTPTDRKKNDKVKSKPRIITWDDCDVVQDFITIYDGYTTRDPVILKFCGGGGNGLYSATSSGPELLVEFITSPYGILSSSPVQSRTLNGFELEVEVKFVDTQSHSYIKNKQMCEFWIRGTGYGELESPKHSLPPNTTCLYHLQGTDPYDQFHSPRRTGITSTQSSRFKVWISVLKFNLSPKLTLFNDDIHEVKSDGMHTNNIANDDSPAVITKSQGGGVGFHYPDEECNGMLRIWDGPLREVPSCNDLNCQRDSKLASKYGQNLTNVIARFCYNRIPKSCDHGVLNDSLSRPCTILESYVSSNNYVTLELRNIESTVLQPVEFKLRYEFIDYQQDGAPIFSEHECHRKFISSETEKIGKFRSVRNIFLFGRGGAVNLNCVYRFEAERDQRIRITIKKVVTSNRQCLSRVDSDTKRSYCFGDQRAKLEIMEQPGDDQAFYRRGCACNSSNTSDLPIIYTSSSQTIELRFTAFNMTALDDPDHLNFEATYEFIKLPLLCKEVKKLTGTSGTINMADENHECRTRQWVIEPSADRYLYVRMNGAYLRKHTPTKSHLISESGIKSSYAIHCSTKARFVITNGDGLSITACPGTENSVDNSFVEMFSSGWETHNDFKEFRPIRSISIEYLDPDDQDYQLTWFEMVPRVALGLVAENCGFVCPELDACVNSSVWCDGINHCPSGYDESFTHCSALLKLPAEVLAGFLVSIILILCIFGAYIHRKIRRSCRGSSILQTRLKSLSSMDTATFDDKDVIC